MPSVRLVTRSKYFVCAVTLLLLSSAGCGTDDEQSEWTEQFDAQVKDIPDDRPDGRASDGSIDADGSVDADAPKEGDADAGPPDLDDVIPNHCRPALADLISKETYRIPSREASVGWKIGPPERGPDVDFDFVGSFQGVIYIDAVVDLPCPPHADSLGLTCGTSELLSFKRPDGNGSKKLVWLAVPIPLSEMALPPEGTDLSVTAENGTLTLRLRPHGQLIFHIGDLPRESSGQTPAETDFNVEYGDIEFAMNAPIDDPQAATCVTHNVCPRIIRLEPLQASASNAETIETGGAGTVSTETREMKIWNVLSYRRNDSHVPDASRLGPDYSSGYCTDNTPPSSRVVMARSSCHESHDGVCLESLCDPQDIEDGDNLICPGLVGVRWTGSSCDVLQCGCRGSECDEMYEVDGTCRQAHRHCN